MTSSEITHLQFWCFLRHEILDFACDAELDESRHLHLSNVRLLWRGTERRVDLSAIKAWKADEIQDAAREEFRRERSLFA